MADGYARSTGRIGVVTAQNGPAATLLVPPLAEAMTVSVPILALVQDVPAANRDRNAFQEFDHAALFASSRSGCVGWTTRPGWMTTWTWRSASPAPGARARWSCCCPAMFSAHPHRRPATPRRAALGHFPLDRVRPAADQVTRAAELLRTAQHPVVIAGGGVHISGASERSGRAAGASRTCRSGPPPWARAPSTRRHPLSLGIVSNYMGRAARRSPPARLRQDRRCGPVRRQPNQRERHRRLAGIPTGCHVHPRRRRRQRRSAATTSPSGCWAMPGLTLQELPAELWRADLAIAWQTRGGRGSDQTQARAADTRTVTAAVTSRRPHRSGRSGLPSELDTLLDDTSIVHR